MSNVNDALVNISLSNIEIDYKFVYNVYNKNETTIEENIINFNNEGEFLNRYIEIRVKLSNLEDTEFYDVSSSDDSLVSELLSKYTLTEEERSYFNNIAKLDKDRIYFNNDINSKESENIIENFYDLSNNSLNFTDENIGKFYNSDSLFALRESIKISMSKDFKEEIKEEERNRFIFSNKKIHDIENVEKVEIKSSIFYNQELDFFESVSQGNLFHNYLAYEEVDDPTNKSHKKQFVGFLVDKFKEEEGKLKYLASAFRGRQTGRDVNYTFYLSDDAVRYGSKYKYVIYPVFRYLAIIPGNYNIDGYALLCETPSITETIDCQEFIRPPHPTNIRAHFFKKENTFVLKWEISDNMQRDIKGFRIFKRKSLNEPFTLVKQIESHSPTDFYNRNEVVKDFEVIKSENSLIYELIDKDFSPSEIQIYSVCSIDAHGYDSNYSDQIAFTYDYFNNELIYDLVSFSGAPLFYPNLLIPRKTIFYNNDDKLVTNTPLCYNKKKFTLMLTPDAYEYSRNNSSNTIEKVINKGTIVGTDLENIKNKYIFNIFRVNNRTLFRDEIKIVEENN